MKPEIYREMAALQERHWWFAARRLILAAVIRRLQLPEQAEILEIGCGTGGNLGMLSAFGRVSAMEYDDYARAVATDVSGIAVAAGALPEPVPFTDGQFDLICLLDVLEHIQDDGAALARVRRLLKPGGYLLVTVPAYSWLWSAHDAAHHHQRRYTASMVRRKAGEAGLAVRRLGYCNTLLFPLIAVARLLRKLTGSTAQDSDAAMPSPWLNRLLTQIFAAERHLLPHGFFPFGTSVLALLSDAPRKR